MTAGEAIPTMLMDIPAPSVFMRHHCFLAYQNQRFALIAPAGATS